MATARGLVSIFLPQPHGFRQFREQVRMIHHQLVDTLALADTPQVTHRGEVVQLLPQLTCPP
jgi:hypothetical protein